MTSPLSPMRLGVLDLAKLAAHFPGNVFLQMQPDNDHGLRLPVAIGGQSSETDANKVAVLGNLGDEVGVRVRRTLIEDHDGSLDRSALSDDWHVNSRSNDWRSHRLVIDAMNRRAEEKRKCL